MIPGKIYEWDIANNLLTPACLIHNLPVIFSKETMPIYFPYSESNTQITQVVQNYVSLHGCIFPHQRPQSLLFLFTIQLAKPKYFKNNP